MQENSAKKTPKIGMNFLMIGSGQIFASTVIAGFIVGYGIDYFLETTPIFMLLCGVLGLVGGAKKVLRIVELEEEQKRLENEHKS